MGERQPCKLDVASSSLASSTNNNLGGDNMNEKELSDLCIKCQWCCQVANVPIPYNKGHNTQEEFAYLYWIKGRRVYWEPFTKEWYWLENKPCQHLSPDGCMIYEDRPRLCRDSWCPFGPHRMHNRYEILCAAGDKIMNRIHDRGIYS